SGVGWPGTPFVGEVLARVRSRYCFPGTADPVRLFNRDRRCAALSLNDNSIQMSEPVVDIPLPTRDDFKQRVRLRRFLLASVFSVLYLIVLAIFYTQDKIDRETLFEAYVIVAALILAFFGLFRLGLNLRFRDPSLTGGQLVACVVTMFR